MFRIGEFSKLMQVSVRMLRYYDEVGLLNPAQSDPWTGYRMYSVEQIPVLNRILYLRDCGFTVAEMEGLVLGNDDRMNRSFIELIMQSRTFSRELLICISMLR